MARDLRSRLAAMRTDAVKKQALRPHGLLTYIDRRPLLQGADSLSQVGLRRMGWDGTAFNIRDCLFLDTETTGLSGGAGTV
ncbi:MAG: ribonuclease H-like domain-containing protein, partial [Clostridia bacterium]|nr:ribonuclease H-like domain-containing protein [Clostridia bacterium]